MHIAVDFDDVCMEFWSSILKCIKKEYGIHLAYEDTTDWEKNELKQLGVFGEGRTWWDWLKERDWLWAQFDAVDGAVGGITLLRQQGHYIEGLTSKPEWAEWTVWSWLGKWRLPLNSVTIVPSGVSKFDVCDAHLLVDDYHKNIVEWTEQGRPAIIFDRPWNRGVWELNGKVVHPAKGVTCLRASDWSDVLRRVQAINEMEDEGVLAA